MESFLQALGFVGLGLLIMVGLLAGFIASTLDRSTSRTRYLVGGVVGAVAIPFLLALIGAGVLVAYGFAAILVAAVVGAVVLLVLVRVIRS